MPENHPRDLAEKVDGWLERAERWTEPLPSDRDPKTLEEAVARLRSSKAIDRAIAATDVVRLFPEHAAAHLEALLEDTAPNVRSQAIDGLRTVSGRAAWPIFVRCLDDANSTVRRSAWGAIRRLSGRGDIAEILQLADEHPRLARSMRIRAGYLERRPRAEGRRVLSLEAERDERLAAPSELPTPPGSVTEQEADDLSIARNLALGRAGVNDRFFVPVRRSDGGWASEERNESKGRIIRFLESLPFIPGR